MSYDAPRDGDASEVWLTILGDLETEVAAVEALVAAAEPADPTDPADATASPAAWSAPDDVPTLPAGLVPRAEALLGRQQRAAHALTELLASNRQHVSAAAGYTSAAVAVPLYWDHSV